MGLGGERYGMVSAVLCGVNGGVRGRAGRAGPVAWCNRRRGEPGRERGWLGAAACVGNGAGVRAREPGAGRWRAARCAGWCALSGCRAGARGEEEEGRAGSAACARSGVRAAGQASWCVRARPERGTRRSGVQGEACSGGGRGRVEQEAKGAGSSALGREERKERGKEEKGKENGKKKRKKGEGEKERERERFAPRSRRRSRSRSVGFRGRPRELTRPQGKGSRCWRSDDWNNERFRELGRTLSSTMEHLVLKIIIARFKLADFWDVTESEHELPYIVQSYVPYYRVLPLFLFTYRIRFVLNQI